MAREEGFPIEPLMDRVFVKKDDMTEVIDKSGKKWHLPQTVKGRAQKGTVVAVGPGYLDLHSGDFYPISVKVGDRITLVPAIHCKKCYFCSIAKTPSE